MSTAESIPLPGQTKTEAQLERGWGNDFEGRALFWIAVAFSAFQIITAMFSPLPSQIVRSVHVGFLMLMVFGVSATLTDRLPTRPHCGSWASPALSSASITGSSMPI
jgi:TRAP-type uncharacterized transport system fused permease subunit